MTREEEAVKRYTIYTTMRPGPEGEVDCAIARTKKIEQRRLYIQRFDHEQTKEGISATNGEGANDTA